jgi:hypothetical protein
MDDDPVPQSKDDGLKPPAPPDRLEGWKAIANYANRDITTVQRWEKTEAFPVHRHPGSKSRVWSTTHEIDEWWKKREGETPPDPLPQAEPPVWRRAAIVVVLGVLGVLGLASVIFRTSPTPRVESLPDRVFARVMAESGTLHELRLTESPEPDPCKLVLSPDGRFLYVIDCANYRNVRVVDLDRNVVESTIEVPGEAADLVSSQDGTTLYFATVSDGIQITDRITGRSRSVHAGLGPVVHDIVLSPDEEWLYIALGRQGLKKYRVRTGEVESISSVICPAFLRFHPEGQQLAISKKCGEPSGVPGRDSIELIDVATERSLMLLQGPPLVGGELFWIPLSDRIFVQGGDACRTQAYEQHNRNDCPYFPGSIAHVWQTSDRSLVKSFATPEPDAFYDPVFTPDGALAVLSGERNLKVVDTIFFRVRESLSKNDKWLRSPVVDSQRRRIYVAGFPSSIYSIDLPESDCNAPAIGMAHYWTLDGTLNDQIADRPLSPDGAPFIPGVLGQGVELTRQSLELTTPNMTMDGVAAVDGTLSIWVRAQGAGPIAEFLQDGKSLWCLRLTPERKPALEIASRPMLISSNSLAEGSWHHLSVARRGTRVELSINGRQQATADSPPAPNLGSSHRTIRFGPLPGSVDEVILYGRFLNESDLERIVKQAKTCLAGGSREDRGK